MKSYLVTGGAGFIGSNFINYLVDYYGEDIKIIVLDKLTYAGNLINLEEVIDEIIFIKGDINNSELMDHIFTKHDIDYVINFAAESHVDRSIKNAKIFLETNTLGVQNLLEIAKKHWKKSKNNYKSAVKFIQISTDEVYGSLNKEADEDSNLNPSSPYAASKASGDLIAKSYYKTYGLPVIITRCSNNYGPYQYPEKLIPLMIQRILQEAPLPVYGDGTNIRDWIYVKDHVRALDKVIQQGKTGEVYNIGANCERENLEVVKLLIDKISELLRIKEYSKNMNCKLENTNYELINFVEDRLGHDYRYSINFKKINNECNWKPQVSFEQGIEKTIKWYLNHQSWIKIVKRD